MRKVAFVFILMGVIGMVFTGKPFFAKEKISDEVHLSADRFSHISVEGELGNIRILPSTSEDIEVKWEGAFSSGSTDREWVSVEENGSELKVNIGKKRFFDVSFFKFNYFNRLQVTILLPEKQFNSLAVRNDVGNTEIKDIQVDNLTTVTDVANLTIDQVLADSIVAETNVGNLTVNHVQGKLNATSDVGRIAVHAKDITDDMTLSSNVGKIKLTVPRIPDNVSFSADSSVGNVKVFGDRGSYIVNQADYIVSIRTDVGGITVDAEQ